MISKVENLKIDSIGKYLKKMVLVFETTNIPADEIWKLPKIAAPF